MKRAGIVILICFCALWCRAQDSDITYLKTDPAILKKYPSLYDAANYFFNHYNKVDDNIELCRKPDGWYASKSVYETDEFVGRDVEKFWDLETAKFIPLTHYTKGKTDSSYIRAYLASCNSDDWRFNPYYGYNGWDRDVISAFGKNRNLPDSVLYGLGRAYTNYAEAFLRGQYMYHTQKKKILGYEKASKEQVDNYVFFEKKCIATIKELAERNPYFQTIVGYAPEKLSNDYVDAWMNLVSIKEDKLAKEFMIPGLYNDAAINIAKNYLNSCPPNAILITNGDNDTYPVLYVQEAEGYRTDVRVLNFTLAFSEWYIAQLYLKHNLSEPVLTTIPFNKYKTGSNEWVEYSQNPSVKSLNVKTFIDSVNSDDIASKLMMANGKYISYYPSKNFFLTADKEALIKKNMIPASMRSRLCDTVFWKVNEENLYKNDLLLLDIIASNHWERPICFASPSSLMDFLDVEKYCYLEGIVYRFMPVKRDSLPGGDVLKERSYDLLMNVFKYGTQIDKHTGSDNFTRDMFVWYRILYAKLAVALLTDGDTNRAIAFLNKGLEIVPDSLIAFDKYILNYGTLYINSGELKKGDIILERIADIYEEKMKYYNSLDNKSRQTVKDDLDEAIKVLQYISDFAEKNNRLELTEKMKGITKNLPK